jgi:hypothetical protein
MYCTRGSRLEFGAVGGSIREEDDRGGGMTKDVAMLNNLAFNARVAKLADARDLKSRIPKGM